MQPTNDFKVRKLPFDLAKCLARYESVPAFIDDTSRYPGGLAYALNLLGMSMVVEFAESLITLRFGRADQTEDFDGRTMFVRQESQHSIYHHILNKFVERQYLKMHYSHLKCNAMAYPFVSVRYGLLLKKIYGESTEGEKREAIKQMDFRMAAFEAAIGLFAACAQFTVTEDHFDEMIKICPPYLYLWHYHLAEELEHVHVSIEHFEKKYQTSLFSGETLIKMNQELDLSTAFTRVLATQLGVRYGYRIEVSEFDQIPQRNIVATMRKNLNSNFKLADVSERRRHILELWEKKFEPALRREVGIWLDSPLKVSRKTA